MRHAGSIFNEIGWFKFYETCGFNVLPKIRVKGFKIRPSIIRKYYVNPYSDNS